MTIQSIIMSDDATMSYTWDAQKYFDQLNRQEFMALASSGWGKDYAADSVAYYFEDKDPEIDRILAYVRSKKDFGFECSVCAEQAIAWIKENRPSWFFDVIVETGSRTIVFPWSNGMISGVNDQRLEQVRIYFLSDFAHWLIQKGVDAMDYDPGEFVNEYLQEVDPCIIAIGEGQDAEIAEKNAYLSIEQHIINQKLISPGIERRMDMRLAMWNEVYMKSVGEIIALNGWSRMICTECGVFGYPCCSDSDSCLCPDCCQPHDKPSTLNTGFILDGSR